MEGGERKRPRVEPTKQTVLFMPLSAPLAWANHGTAIPADFVCAIRIPAAHYLPFGRGFADHKLHPAVIQAQSVLLLYLQALLSIKPPVICLCYAQTNDAVESARVGAKIKPNVCPSDVVLLSPLTYEQVGDVLSKLGSLTGPPPLDDRGRPQRRPTPTFNRGADYRRVSNPRSLFLGSEQLSGSPVQKSDDILMKPTIELTVDEISDTIPNHFLSICDASKVLSSRWVAADEQRKVENYFTVREDGGKLFKLAPIIDALGARCFGINEQIKMFYSGQEPDSNKLLNYALPHREASDKKLRELVMNALMLKGLDPQVMAGTPTKDFIVNGYTIAESNDAGSHGHAVCRGPDPQLNTPIEDNIDPAFEAMASINDKITAENYPMLRHTQIMFGTVLANEAAGENRAKSFCNLYRSAIQSCQSGGGAGFPAALYELLQEATAFEEANLAGPENEYVRQLWSFKGTGAPLGGYDTLGTIISQIYYLGLRAMNLMSTQIPSWIVLTTSILGGAVRNTNKKLRFALVGTAESGKTHVGLTVAKSLPATFNVTEGDDSALVKVHMGNLNALRVSFRDEVAERGDDKNSKDQENTRGFRYDLTAKEDGYGVRQSVVVDDSGPKVERSFNDMRTMEMMCFNNVTFNQAYKSRLVEISFKDPPKAESKRVKLVAQSNRLETELATRLTKMIGFGQIITSYPGHFGLDTIGTNTQLLYVFCSLLETVGGRLSPSGREMGKLENHLCNITDLRLAAEAQRFACVRPGTTERPTAPEMALQCMVNRVASPADVLAAYGSLNSCGYTAHQIINCLIEAMITMLQQNLQPDPNDASKLSFCGFELVGGYFILQQLGAGRKTADNIDLLADRVHKVVSTLMPMSSPSKPDVRNGLQDLTQRFIDGSAALTTRAWTNPNDGDEKGVIRWAISAKLIKKAKIGRVRALLAGLEMLVGVISKTKGTPYVSLDEKRWLIPLDEFGDVAMLPVEFKGNTDRNLRRVAETILLPPNMVASDSTARENMLTAKQADEIFRITEQLDVVTVEHFNTGKVYFAVDRANTTGPASLKDPTKGLQEVSVRRGYISVAIETCKAYASVDGESVDRLAEVAQAFLAITLPPESFDAPYKIYMGQETKASDGTVALQYVPEFDPNDFDEVVTTDWLYRESNTDESEFMPPPPTQAGNIMPGTRRTVTYRYRDALYEVLLQRQAEEHGMPPAYTTYWHIRGWRP